MKGICHLSSIPVRSEPSSKSEIVNVLLFGETFDVKEQKDDWVSILTEADQYAGWINEKQFFKLTHPIASPIITSQYPYTEADSPLGKTMLLPGSILPDFQEGAYQLNGKPYTVSQSIESHNSADILPVARQFLNAPYLWGGKTPFGIDCSGFVQVVYRICGIKMSRDAWQQAQQGESIDSRKDVKPGDLAFFHNTAGRITHVGIMIAPGEIIHASGYVRIDDMDDHGIINNQNKQYSHTLNSIKRVI